MAQPLRIEYPGACCHMMSRGNQRRQIVRDDADRHERLDWLRRAVETYGWRLHAFVLMNTTICCFGYRSKDVAVALGYSSAGGVGQAIGRVEAARSRIGRVVRELARRLTNG